MALVNDSSVKRNCSSCVNVVTSAHTYIDSRFMALCNSALNSFSERVHETKDSNHGKTSFHNLTISFFFKVVVVCLEGFPLTFVVVTVRDEKSSVTFFCKCLHNFLSDNAIFLFLGKFFGFSVLANVGLTVINHNFGSTLAVNSNFSFKRWVSYSAGCSLSGGGEWNHKFLKSVVLFKRKH